LLLLLLLLLRSNPELQTPALKVTGLASENQQKNTQP
jgi:hypothetical protein